MKNYKCIITALTAFTLLFSLCGCSENDNSSDSGSANVVYYDSSSNVYVNPEEEAKIEKESDEQAKENASKIEAKIDEPANAYDCIITASNIVYLGNRPDINDNTKEYELYAMKFDITNNSTETIDASALGNDFIIKVDDEPEQIGTDATAFSFAKKTIGQDFNLINVKIEPGNTESGYITFSAHTGWQNASVNCTLRVEEKVYDTIVYNISSSDIQK